MNTIEKFQSLLHELFQFEASDLDFGIYRILNFKREQIDKFIKEDIKNQIESAFARHKDERLKDISEQFEEAKRKVSETLGTNAFTPAGDIKPEFTNTPVGKDYLQVKEQRDLAHTIDEIKLQVFNDLYSFFSRYYEEGDFIPQYRYSIKSHKYAIPFNGEEVKLYWTNAEQYYTKTGILFRDYSFYTDPGKAYKIIFRTVSAKEELSSNKATKARFFILDDEKPIEKIPSPLVGEGKGEGDKTLIIRFQYRELTDKEVKSYSVEGGSNTAKQEKINQKIFNEILKQIKDTTLKGFLSNPPSPPFSKGGQGGFVEKPLLFYQLSRFTAKNTKDYFIHKNLKRFLSEQLDYFIKADVLSIMTLENEPFLDKHITRAKVVREIGEKIIDFLAQIEDFQKRLWEKKKFVLKTDYVITTDRVPEEFHKEILNNKNQLKEWKELGFIEDVIPAKAGIQKLKLPVDTKYFSEEFKERLLEKITENADLDDLLDGVLIKSENYQALNLLLGKYKGDVQTTYIDPPFNLGTNADFLYNVNYKDSTWISMLENRLWLAKELLNEKGSIFVRCDYNGNMYVRLLMNEVFGENFRNEIVVNRIKKNVTQQGRINIPTATDSLYYFVRSEKSELVRANRKLEKTKDGYWHAMDSAGIRYPKERIIFGQTMLPPDNRHFTFTQNRIDAMVKQGKIRINPTSGRPEYWIDSKDEVSLDSNWLDISGYTFTTGFSTENSEQLLNRVIDSTSNKSNFILDFFLGSGTTTAVAHKLGRKWIGIEMGEHFWTVVLPRMKKVLAYDKSGISKEVKDYKGGGFFKYQILEQYEDTLDNIELKENKQAEGLFKDEYLLKYFLEFETQESPYLMNIERLKDPFSYRLKVNLDEVGEPVEMAVDIPETFNYLLGLKVKKVKAREIQTIRHSRESGNPEKTEGLDSCLRRNDNMRKYLFILGEKDGINTAIVWRNFDDKWDENDYKKDRAFIINELKAWMPYRVYINGQSSLTTNLEGHTIELYYIEPEFKNLMEG